MWDRIRRWFRREESKPEWPKGRHRKRRDPHAPVHEKPHMSPGERWLRGEFDRPPEENDRHE
jgi:hypothetical protein